MCRLFVDSGNRPPVALLALQAAIYQVRGRLPLTEGLHRKWQGATWEGLPFHARIAHSLVAMAFEGIEICTYTIYCTYSNILIIHAIGKQHLD